MKLRIISAALLVPLGAILTAVAAEEEKQGWDPDTKFPALPPAEALKTIEVPAGYHLQCIASEPMVEEPTAFAFDGNGAIYVCEWRSYMQDEHATDQNKPVSRVVKLVDTKGGRNHGQAHRVHRQRDPPAHGAPAPRPRAGQLQQRHHRLGLF